MNLIMITDSGGGGGGDPMSIVQSASVSAYTSSSRTVTLSSAVTSGNGLVVWFQVNEGTTITSVTHNGSGGPHSLTLVGSATAIGGQIMRCYAVANITTGPTEITINVGSGSGTTIGVAEVENLAVVLEDAVQQENGSSATWTLGFTSDSNNALAVAVANPYDGVTFTPTSPLVEMAGGTNYVFAGIYSTAGSNNGVLSLSPNRDGRWWIIVLGTG